MAIASSERMFSLCFWTWVQQFLLEILQKSLSALLIDRLTIRKARAEKEPRQASRCHDNRMANAILM